MKPNNSNKRLLILSCSARKSDDLLCPAIDRYLSPAFFVVRRWLRNNPQNQTVIWIVSAKYGLIESSRPIDHYETALTIDRAAFLAEPVSIQFQTLSCLEFADVAPEYVFCHLPKTYLELMKPHLKELRRVSNVSVAHGAPGIKLRFLKSWLEKEK